jgi:hypothetical protein
MPRFRITLGTLALAAVTAACADVFSAGDVSGTYVLRSVDETPVPLSAIQPPTIVLATPSSAVRRSTYRVCAMGSVHEAVAVGTFHLQGTTLELALRNGDLVWRLRGELVGERITLRYADPASGPDIVALYERL